MLYVLTFFVKKSNFECIKNKLIDFYFKINFNFHPFIPILKAQNSSVILNV